MSVVYYSKRMKVNQNTLVVGKKVMLVPYEKHHVIRYHEWMKTPELQELTASEPLSLEDEYKMQQSWREDKDKCTFIVLDALAYNSSNKTESEEVACMVGDVNVFFNDEENKESAEIEIMIAEPNARGKGYGKEALLSMMRYAIETLRVKNFTAKIGYSNTPSLTLFQKIGFHEISRSDVFKEVTLELKLMETLEESLTRSLDSYAVLPYRPSL